ncbi:MAG: SIMPL domain-containing protein, partial [Terriglobales bacterium]
MKRFLFTIAVIAISGSLLAQDIQVNRQNKTISVTADESATADAEVAVLEIGYHNYGITQDAAFQENVRAAERITNALLNAKIPKANIETEKLQLARTEIDEKWTADMKKERQFTAEQSWHITVSASEAQSVVDLAVKSGANEVEDVEWNVADPLALQAKAGGAALA